jgi:hypothetical protein
MPAGTEVVYLDRVETAWPLRFHLQPGSRVPLHCSASGKLFMAWMPPVQRNRLLGHLQYKSYTPNTITTRLRLEAELARVRAQGYALDNEEYLDGLVCVAVPVFDPRSRQKVRGSVAVQAPASRFPIERATSARALQRTAEAPGRSIGQAEPGGPNARALVCRRQAQDARDRGGEERSGARRRPVSQWTGARRLRTALEPRPPLPAAHPRTAALIERARTHPPLRTAVVIPATSNRPPRCRHAPRSICAGRPAVRIAAIAAAKLALAGCAISTRPMTCSARRPRSNSPGPARPPR